MAAEFSTTAAMFRKRSYIALKEVFQCVFFGQESVIRARVFQVQAAVMPLPIQKCENFRCRKGAPPKECVGAGFVLMENGNNLPKFLEIASGAGDWEPKIGTDSA